MRPRALDIALAQGIELWPDAHEHLSGPIDLWWVVHDGGLLMLLSIILRRARVWHEPWVEEAVMHYLGEQGVDQAPPFQPETK